MMVSVKRKRRRSLRQPTPRYILILGVTLLSVLLIGLTCALVRANQLNDRLGDLSDFMAKSIRTDLNQAVQTFNSIDRRSADTAGEVLPNLKKYMYAAYDMNRLLVSARGDSYSILDGASYNSFQTLVTEYERLLSTGQNTTEIKAQLGDYISSIETMLVSRFDSADALLPQTASRAGR